MCPQFVVAAILRTEVERITGEYRHVTSGVTVGAADISHLPS